MSHESQRNRSQSSPQYRPWRWGMVAVAALSGVTGCSRTMTITQADYINTAVHRSRPPGNRTGERLEVDIVCVYPKDLDKQVNELLSPDKGITCDLWYQHRPTTRQSGGTAFDLPRNQIYLLTDEKDVFGKAIGKSLRGAKQDGKDKIKLSGIDFREEGFGKFAGSLFNERAVLYVFPRFIGPDGKIMRVAPAKFHPPGAYRSELFVEIGVEDPGGAAVQYIKNTTQRKVGSGEEKEKKE